MRRVERGISADSLLCGTEVMDGSVEAHVRHEIDAVSQVVHDLLDALLKV